MTPGRPFSGGVRRTASLLERMPARAVLVPLDRVPRVAAVPLGRRLEGDVRIRVRMLNGAGREETGKDPVGGERACVLEGCFGVPQTGARAAAALEHVVRAETSLGDQLLATLRARVDGDARRQLHADRVEA